MVIAPPVAALDAAGELPPVAWLLDSVSFVPPVADLASDEAPPAVCVPESTNSADENASPEQLVKTMMAVASQRIEHTTASRSSRMVFIRMTFGCGFFV